MTFSGYLEDYIGVRFTIITGCAIMASGVLLTYFTIQVTQNPTFGLSFKKLLESHKFLH